MMCLQCCRFRYGKPNAGLINSFDFSHNGKWIVLANSDGIIKVLDVQTGACVTRIENQFAYGGLACSSNGRWIATATSKGIVKVIDVHSGMTVAQMDRGEHKWQSNDISQLQFSPDGKLLAAKAGNPKLYSNEDDDYDQLLNPDTEGDQIYVWDPETGEALIKFAGSELAFSEDSRLLAGAASDETVEAAERVDRCVSVWDIVSRERIAHFTGHTDWVDDVAFSPCRQFVASSDRTLRIWDLATGSQKMAYPDLYDPFYLKEGKLFALRFRRSTDTTEVWDVEKHEKILEMSNGIGGFDFSKSLAIAYTQNQLQQSNKKRFSKQVNGNIPVYAILREHRFPWPDPKGIWVDNQTLASRTEGPGMLLWDVAKKQIRGNLLKDEGVGSFTVLRNGRILASCIGEESKVWDAKQPDNPIAEFTAPEAPSEWARHAVFAPTGDRIAVGSRKGTLYVWNFEQPEHPVKLTGHTAHIWALAFSPDGKRLVSGASASDYTARIWDVELGEEIATLPMDERRVPMGFAFSPCGTLIVGGMSNEIRFWCAEKLTTLRTIPQPENSKCTYALTFSPCGNYLASGTWWREGMEKMAIRIWDVATDENIHTFWGHTSDVQSLAFSPDGTHLASSGFDGTILVWDLKPVID